MAWITAACHSLAACPPALQSGTDQLHDTRARLEAALAMQAQAEAREAALAAEALAAEQRLQAREADMAELRSQADQLVELRRQHSELQQAALRLPELETARQVGLACTVERLLQ
jgi:hypothetical protein